MSGTDARPLAAEPSGPPSGVREVLYAAAGLMPGKTPGEIALWFAETPLEAFGGRTPRGMVEDGDAEALLSHLAALEDGVYA